MRVKIRRIDKTLPLPKYETRGAVALDLYSRKTVTIQPGQLVLLPSNVIIQTPPGYMFLVVPRSSTPKKFGLSIPHGIGIVDQDFRGPEDEILLQLFNFTKKAVTVQRGIRICQAVFVKIAKASLQEAKKTLQKSRGGFGSTG